MGINKTITTKLQFCYPFCTSKLKNHSLTSVFAHFFYKICHFLKNTIVVNFVKQKLIVDNSRQFRHIETCLGLSDKKNHIKREKITSLA